MGSFTSGIERRVAGVLVLLLAAGLTGGCGKVFLLQEPLIHGGEVSVPPPSPRARQTGSLWRDHVSANYLFTDVRARFPGDLVTVLIVEDAEGEKEAETTTERDTDLSFSLSEFFGLPQQLQNKNPTIDPTQLVESASSSNYDGKGTTSRKGELTARMTAQVTAVAPNGNLHIEGEKIVTVNRESQHIVLNGWVRPEDINTQNEVVSTRLASGRVEYYGTGPLATQQRRGWGLWVLETIWPF